MGIGVFFFHFLYFTKEKKNIYYSEENLSEFTLTIHGKNRCESLKFTFIIFRYQWLQFLSQQSGSQKNPSLVHSQGSNLRQTVS